MALTAVSKIHEADLETTLNSLSYISHSHVRSIGQTFISFSLGTASDAPEPHNNPLAITGSKQERLFKRMRDHSKKVPTHIRLVRSSVWQLSNKVFLPDAFIKWIRIMSPLLNAGLAWTSLAMGHLV